MNRVTKQGDTRKSQWIKKKKIPKDEATQAWKDSLGIWTGLKPPGQGTHMDVPDLLLGQHPPGLQSFPLRLLCRDGGRGQLTP